MASNRSTWLLRWWARRGAAPIRSASRFSSSGFARSSENSCTPDGRPVRNSSNSRKAASRSGWSCSEVNSAGVSSVRSSRARVDARGADMAVMPGADAARDRRRVLEPHAGQCLQRLGVVAGAGEDEAGAGAQVRLALEQGGVVALHREQRGEHQLFQCRRLGEAGEGREPLEIRLALGQRLGLPVGHHLQPVLELAQHPIGRDQLRRRVRLHPAPLGQGGERGTGLRLPQAGLAAAQDELLGLGEELDLADAAAADLEVVAEDADGAEAAIGVDLPLDRVDVADRGVVQVLAPDERHQRFEEAPRRRRCRRRQRAP